VLPAHGVIRETRSAAGSRRGKQPARRGNAVAITSLWRAEMLARVYRAVFLP
jgi:hypothetical protein